MRDPRRGSRGRDDAGLQREQAGVGRQERERHAPETTAGAREPRKKRSALEPATPPGYAQALLERVELRSQLVRELLAELRVVLVHLRQLLLPAVDVDGQQLLHRRSA